MIRRIVSAPVKVLLLPVRGVRGVSRMRFSTVLAIATGGGAAFTAARRLMDRDDAVQELPEGLQQPAARARTFLVRSRGHLTNALSEANSEQTAAEIELRREYLRKTGRLAD